MIHILLCDPWLGWTVCIRDRVECIWGWHHVWTPAPTQFAAAQVRGWCCASRRKRGFAIGWSSSSGEGQGNKQAEAEGSWGKCGQEEDSWISQIHVKHRSRPQRYLDIPNITIPGKKWIQGECISIWSLWHATSILLGGVQFRNEMPDELRPRALWILNRLSGDLQGARMWPVKLAHLKHQEALSSLPHHSPHQFG